jgi:hypothetical protein
LELRITRGETTAEETAADIIARRTTGHQRQLRVGVDSFRYWDESATL